MVGQRLVAKRQRRAPDAKTPSEGGAGRRWKALTGGRRHPGADMNSRAVACVRATARTWRSRTLMRSRIGPLRAATDFEAGCDCGSGSLLTLAPAVDGSD